MGSRSLPPSGSGVDDAQLDTATAACAGRRRRVASWASGVGFVATTERVPLLA